MTPLDQFLVLVTPAAIVTAVLSGVSFALVIHALRPTADGRLITFLSVLLGALIYLPQAAQLAFVFATTGDGVQPWATLGRWSLFTFAFVPAMWATLRWRTR